MSKADLIQEIRRLPFAERVELLEELWSEIESERPELLEWQERLIDQRLRNAEADPEDWVSLDEAKQRLERQLHSHCGSSASVHYRTPEVIVVVGVGPKPEAVWPAHGKVLL